MSGERTLITRRYLVKGRVQGVGFRWFVQREAQTLGIGGWVRNDPQGAVEVLAAGSEEQHAALVARLRTGPRGARVDAVEQSEAAALDGAKSFRIEGAW